MSHTRYKAIGNNKGKGNKLNEFLNGEWCENVNWWVKRLTNKRRRAMVINEVNVQIKEYDERYNEIVDDFLDSNNL